MNDFWPCWSCGNPKPYSETMSPSKQCNACLQWCPFSADEVQGVRYRVEVNNNRLRRLGRENERLEPYEWVRILVLVARYKCEYCDCSLTAMSAEIEHIQPISRDGKNLAPNIAAACHDCNHRKRTDTWIVPNRLLYYNLTPLQYHQLCHDSQLSKPWLFNLLTRAL